jgi:hypothetical protein
MNGRRVNYGNLIRFVNPLIGTHKCDIRIPEQQCLWNVQLRPETDTLLYEHNEKVSDKQIRLRSSSHEGDFIMKMRKKILKGLIQLKLHYAGKIVDDNKFIFDLII